MHSGYLFLCYFRSESPCEEPLTSPSQPTRRSKPMLQRFNSVPCNPAKLIVEDSPYTRKLSFSTHPITAATFSETLFNEDSNGPMPTTTTEEIDKITRNRPPLVKEASIDQTNTKVLVDLPHIQLTVTENSESETDSDSAEILPHSTEKRWKEIRDKMEEYKRNPECMELARSFVQDIVEKAKDEARRRGCSTPTIVSKHSYLLCPKIGVGFLLRILVA